jgi:hypothetical protein
MYGSTPVLVGWSQDHMTKFYEFKVGLENHVYTYIMESSYYAQGIVRAAKHFNFKQLNKLKKFGRLIMKETIRDDPDEEE